MIKDRVIEVQNDIPLPLQFSCFACYLHIVEWIAQSQTLEYRFGRYLPVLFAQAHNILHPWYPHLRAL